MVVLVLISLGVSAAGAYRTHVYLHQNAVWLTARWR